MNYVYGVGDIGSIGEGGGDRKRVRLGSIGDERGREGCDKEGEVEEEGEACDGYYAEVLAWW